MILWKDIVSSEIKRKEKDLEKRCLEKLFEKDDNLGAFYGMDPFTQKRETFFLLNSVKGFTGFLKQH